MEFEQSNLSRPVTHWKRERESYENSQNSTENPNFNIRPYSKMERPTSRRGIKTDITEYGISRPPTSGRNVLSRPPSANIMSNRVSTPSARINTMSSANLSRVNSGLPRHFVQPNTFILDRPITQHGLAGVRIGSSRGVPRMTKQIQDKMYQKQLLQRKIEELNQEITSITQEVNKQNKDNPIYTNHEKKVNTELTELQDQLTDYNDTLDKMITETDKKNMEYDARELKELNKKMQALKEDNGSLTEHNQLSFKKFKLEEKFALSPIKQEAYKLFLKIFEVEDKKNQLLENETSNNSSESATEKQIIEIQNKIADAEQELLQLETDLDDVQSEKLNKPASENNKAEELEKLSYLEELIVERLERISNNISETLDSSILSDDETQMIKELMEQKFDDKNGKNLEELKESVIYLRQTLNKLDTIEIKIKSKLNEHVGEAMGQVTSLNDTEIYKEIDENRPKKLLLQKQDLMNYESKADEELEIVKKNYDKLKELYEQNEMYRSISILEDKLGKGKYDNDQLEESTKEKDEKIDNSLLKEKLLSLTTQYNSILINELKSIY